MFHVVEGTANMRLDICIHLDVVPDTSLVTRTSSMRMRMKDAKPLAKLMAIQLAL